MSVYSSEIQIITKCEGDIIDITSNIQDIVKVSKIRNGIICVFVPGSTGTLTTIEYEPGLMNDFPKALDKIAPKSIEYDHHNTWHDDNGRSHVKASLMGPSIAIPVIDGKVIHGNWQQIVFIELDTRSRNRDIIVQIVGE